MQLINFPADVFHYFGSFVILRHPLLVNCASAVLKFGMDGLPMISMNFAKEVNLSLGRFAKAQIACAFQVGGTDQWRKLRRCLLFLSFFSAVSLHNCKIAQYSTISHCNGATSVCICISTNNLLVFVVVLTRMALREAIKNYLADFFLCVKKSYLSPG